MILDVTFWELFWLKYGTTIISFSICIGSIIILLLIWLGFKIYEWIENKRKEASNG